MTLKTITLTALTIFGINQSVNAQCVSDENNVYSFVYNGNTYEIVKENKNWVDAAACAVSRGGFLTEIDSQTEQDAIFTSVNAAGITSSNTVAPDGGGASYLWIGGNDLATEGKWSWDGNNDGSATQFWQGTSSGSVVGGLYNNWGNEPDDFGSGQDGLGFAFTDWPLGVAGQWNDVDHTNTLYYIIEYIGDPLGLNESKTNLEFSIYPNPCANNLSINLPTESQINETSVAKIYNLLGEVVKEVKLTSTNQIIDTQNLENGVYFIKVENALVGDLVKKFVVRK